MLPHIFREYDIRGIIGKELLIEEIYNLTKAIITFFKQKSPQIKSIVVAKDGRTHSDKIQIEIIRAITDLGLDVIDIGLCPTPTFYFSLFTLNTQSGMIITASHNPAEYNGLKICLNTRSVYGKQIQEIRKIYETENFYSNNSGQQGKVRKYKIIPDYVEWLSKHFSHLKNNKINAVIDCGNGTAGTVLPSLIKKMNLQNVTLLYDQVDGTFPNHPADPTDIKNMQTVLKELQNNPNLHVGIGFDGDCDRMNPMTKKGFLVPGDQLLTLYAKKVLQEFPHATIVFDIKSSASLIETLKSWGATNCICPSGHSLVKEALIKNEAKLAGELSCHFFFKDRYFGYDDGIYAALRLFEILKDSKDSLDNLIKIFPEKERSPEIRIKCAESDKDQIIEHVKQIFEERKDVETLTIDGIRAQTNYGWGLVRASNTQSVICLRFESETKEGLAKIKNDFISALKPFFQENELKEKIEL